MASLKALPLPDRIDLYTTCSENDPSKAFALSAATRRYVHACSRRGALFTDPTAAACLFNLSSGLLGVLHLVSSTRNIFRRFTTREISSGETQQRDDFKLPPRRSVGLWLRPSAQKSLLSFASRPQRSFSTTTSPGTQQMLLPQSCSNSFSFRAKALVTAPSPCAATPAALHCSLPVSLHLPVSLQPCSAAVSLQQPHDPWYSQNSSPPTLTSASRSRACSPPQPPRPPTPLSSNSPPTASPPSKPTASNGRRLYLLRYT